MKKRVFALLSFVVFIATSSFAQQGKTQVGVNASYGTNFSNIGFGVKANYGFTNELRGEFSANIFLNTKEVKNAWDLNFDLHYTIMATMKATFYPIIGFVLATDKFEGSRVTRPGMNVGLGLDYAFTDHIVGVMQLKYQLIKKRNPTLISFGVAYKF